MYYTTYNQSLEVFIRFQVFVNFFDFCLCGQRIPFSDRPEVPMLDGIIEYLTSHPSVFVKL